MLINPSMMVHPMPLDAPTCPFMVIGTSGCWDQAKMETSSEETRRRKDMKESKGCICVHLNLWRNLKAVYVCISIYGSPNGLHGHYTMDLLVYLIITGNSHLHQNSPLFDSLSLLLSLSAWWLLCRIFSQPPPLMWMIRDKYTCHCYWWQPATL